MQKVRYTATTYPEHPFNPLPVVLSTWGYGHVFDRMLELISQYNREHYFSVDGVNGGINPDELEPYLKEIKFPEMTWYIKREVEVV